MTLSKFDSHSSPLLKSLEIIKIFDLVDLQIAVFMYEFHNPFLPPNFNSLFIQVNTIHKYNNRHVKKQSCYLPRVRTNYGIFNIRFRGTKVWNLECHLIRMSSQFDYLVLKLRLRTIFLANISYTITSL